MDVLYLRNWYICLVLRHSQYLFIIARYRLAFFVVDIYALTKFGFLICKVGSNYWLGRPGAHKPYFSDVGKGSAPATCTDRSMEWGHLHA